MFHTLRIEMALIHLHNLPFFIDEKRSGKGDVAVTIEEITIKDVVNVNHVLRLPENGKRVFTATRYFAGTGGYMDHKNL